MTVKLYDEDAYGREFDAVVSSVVEYKGRKAYVLDRTFFFPEEGGQSHDRGTLGGFNVTDVQIKDEILHFVDGELKVGDRVHGSVDFDFRFRNMQCHSAEHIFSGLVYSKFGFNNCGFHLSDSSLTMDYDGYISPEEIAELEKEVNRIITENRRVKTWYPSPEELATYDYRSKKELTGPVRLVSIEGADLCACCAPHVSRTGEIGVFKVITSEKYKGGVRVNFLAGFRAFEDYCSKHEDLRKISRILNTASSTEVSAVASVFNENSRLKFEITGLKQNIVKSRIEAAPESDVFLFTMDESFLDCMDYALKLVLSRSEKAAVLVEGNDKESRFVVAAPADLNGLSAVFKEKYGAKCGGRDGVLRGSISISREDFEKEINAFLK